VGDAAYVADSRVQLARPALGRNWNLRIHKVKLRDNGTYLCQTSHHPPASLLVRLAVYGGSGGPDPHPLQRPRPP
jgi:hypothetical protein